MSIFADLHVPGRPLLLVNAWDVASALLLAADGHPAIGTTSLGITAAAGVLDGAGAGLDLTRTLVRQLTSRLALPLTVDLEGGYAEDPGAVADLVAELAERGVAGVNLEDGARTPAAHAAVLRAVRDAAPATFVNARTDAFWSGDRDLPDALDRLAAYRDAGADGIFVPGLDDPGGIEEIVRRVDLPLNVLWQPGVDQAALGVARISTGSLLHRTAMAAVVATAAAARGGLGPTAGAVGYDDLQALLRSGGADAP